MLYIRSILYALAFYATTVVMLIAGLWLLLAPRSWAMTGLALHGRICTWLLQTICGTELEVRGRENLPAPPYLVAAKHQSAWDTFALVPLFRDPAIVLKEELKYIPVYGWFCLKFKHILVRRERAATALKHMVADAKICADQGREILIFPEGTRQAPDAPPNYKPGYVALYEGLGIPCVPLALNSGIFWPRRSLWRHPGTIVVEFLAPVPQGLPRAEFRNTIENRLDEATRRLVAEARNASPGISTYDASLDQIKNRT